MPYAERFIIALLRIFNIRIVRPGLPNRIGHLVQDFESYIKERKLRGCISKPIYIVDERKPCNSCLIEYWRKYIIILEGYWAKKLAFLLEQPQLVDELEHRYAYTLVGSSPCFTIEDEWGSRPPLFRLKKSHRKRGENALRQMGVPSGTWFVCLHARGGGYSPVDEAYHHYRNVSIETFSAAVDEIIRRGGWCIRMGDPTMEPLPPMRNTIDYAHSHWKCDWMDVFLCAECRFFLGSSSGLSLVSAAFGVPSAITNTAPMGCAYSFYRNDISIPQIFEQNGEPIPFPTLLASPIADLRYAQDIEKAGVVLRRNTEKQVLELACEMLDRLDGVFQQAEGADGRQLAFKNLFHEGNYSYGSVARIGDAFLKEHEHLLNPAALCDDHTSTRI